MLHFVSRDAGRVTSLTANNVLFNTPGATLNNNVSINIETSSLPHSKLSIILLFCLYTLKDIDDYFESFMKRATINSTELPYAVQLKVTRGNAVALQPSISFSYVMSLNPDSKLPSGVAVVFKNATISAEDVDGKLI